MVGSLVEGSVPVGFGRVVVVALAGEMALDFRGAAGRVAELDHEPAVGLAAVGVDLALGLLDCGGFAVGADDVGDFDVCGHFKGS